MWKRRSLYLYLYIRMYINYIMFNVVALTYRMLFDYVCQIVIILISQNKKDFIFCLKLIIVILIVQIFFLRCNLNSIFTDIKTDINFFLYLYKRKKTF